MPFLLPLALAGLVFLPVVVAMYLLRLRRDPAVVPSTLLWRRLVADVEANAPWQRLRRSLLLLLQLLLVALLAFLAARPFVERPATLARDLVVVVDVSASMAATDVAPDRLAAAVAAVDAALDELPGGGRVSVVEAGRTARVVVNATDDLARVRQALGDLRVLPVSGDLGDALRLASALAARSGDAEILVATDAAVAPPAAGALEAPVRVLAVGRERRNQAIVALSVRAASSGLAHQAFLSIANTDVRPAERRIEVYADGVLRESRDILLDPQTRTGVSIDDVDDPSAPAAVIEVRLVAKDPDAAGPADDLALDDRAWAVVPPERLRRVLLVGEGDPYLETALTWLPDTELYGVEPDAYGAATKPELFDLLIFEGFVPDVLPPRPVLLIAPPATSPLGTVTGTLVDPGIGATNPDEPVLRYVDLSTVHIGRAARMELPAWARAVIPGPGGAPLLYAGETGGRRAAVMAFDPRRSDLPLQVAFPVLLANLVGELTGGAEAPLDAVAPGAPVTLAIPPGAVGVRVERPDGSVDELPAPVKGAASVTFARTDLLGVYAVTPIPDPAATAAPAGTATKAPSATPASASPAATGTPGPVPTPPLADPDAPVLFAVDLLDVDESSLAPRSAAAIEALGAPRTPGQAAERPPARAELWLPLLLVVLLVLVVEGLVYERDTLARLRRNLAARVAARRGGGAA